MKLFLRKYVKQRIFFLVIVLAIGSALPATAQQTINPAPFVIPALREWQGATGIFHLEPHTTLVVDPTYSTALMPIAITFLDDLKHLSRRNSFSVRKGKPRKGDIYFTLKPADTSIRKEGYILSVNDFIKVEASQATGAFWATRTLLQILEQDH